MPSEQLSDAALVMVDGGAVVVAAAVCWGNAKAGAKRKENRAVTWNKFILAVLELTIERKRQGVVKDRGYDG